jgi:hypothetical protein
MLGSRGLKSKGVPETRTQTLSKLEKTEEEEEAEDLEMALAIENATAVAQKPKRRSLVLYTRTL